MEDLHGWNVPLHHPFHAIFPGVTQVVPDSTEGLVKLSEHLENMFDARYLSHLRALRACLDSSLKASKTNDLISSVFEAVCFP